MDDALSFWDNYGRTPASSAPAYSAPASSTPSTAESTAQTFDVGSFLGNLANAASTVLVAQNGVRPQQPTGQPATTAQPTVLVAAPGSGTPAATVGGIPAKTLYIVGGSIVAALVLFKLMK